MLPTNNIPPIGLSRNQQQLLTTYITQYNQTNAHIEMLTNMLDEISANIINILNTPQTRRPRRRPINTNTNANDRTSENSIPNPSTTNNNFNDNSVFRDLYYTDSSSSSSSSSSSTSSMPDYYTTAGSFINAPTNAVNNPRVPRNQDMQTLFSNFLNTPVTVRPTPEQIENASRLVKYGEIDNPSSDVCPISLEPFTSNMEVRQLLHCGHIFHPTQFQTWFSGQVKCPVCRYDIRTGTDIEPSSSSSSGDASNQSVNTFIDQVARNLFQSILYPDNQTNNDTFLFDPSNNILFYETIIRPNRNHL